jgi:hypothetical protein
MVLVLQNVQKSSLGNKHYVTFIRTQDKDWNTTYNGLSVKFYQQKVYVEKSTIP